MLAHALEPSPFLLEHSDLFSVLPPGLPVLDLACGEGDNGIFLASKGFEVVLVDRSRDLLHKALRKAQELGLKVETRQLDLEKEGVNPFGNDRYAGVIIFRYLHRPLIPHIRGAIAEGGLLLYETFTTEQAKFGRPRNQDYLLKPGELRSWFEDWRIIHYFEGILDNPTRAVARLACRKPFATAIIFSRQGAGSCP